MHLFLRFLLASALTIFLAISFSGSQCQIEVGSTAVPKDVLEYGSRSGEANKRAFAEHNMRTKRLSRNGQGEMLLQERGPSNLGGRTRAVMFDPNDPKKRKVWAGGVTGGLWYNNDITDAESSWHFVSKCWANLSVTWIASDPGNTDVWYVSTGECQGALFEGAGLWKTTNGGISWSQIPETANNENFGHIAKVVVTRQGTVLILVRLDSQGAGLWRSPDGGKTWTHVIENAEGADIEVTPDGDIIASTYTLGDWEGAVYKSSFEDDGAPGTWNNISPNAMEQTVDLELAVAPSNANIIYAIGSNLETGLEWGMHTNNGGDSWTFFDAPLHVNTNTCTETADLGFTNGVAQYMLAASVHPTNSDVLYLGGVHIYRTSNAGKNWSLVGADGDCAPAIHVDHHTFIFRPEHDEEMVLANDGGVYYSQNAGDFTGAPPEYQMRNKNYNVTQFYAAAMENEAGSNYMLAGAQDNGTQVFTKPGFGPTTKVTPNDGLLCFIDQDNSDHQVTSSQNNIVFYSSDGENYTQNNQNKTVEFENPMDYDSNGGILYMAGNDGELMVTALAANDDEYIVRDIGVESGRIYSLHMSPHVQSRVYVGTSSSDQLVLWVYGAYTGNNMSIHNATGDLKLTWVNSIDFGETTNDLLVTGFRKQGVASECAVWATNDGGTHWEEKQGDLPKGMAVNYGIYNPHNREQVMLATEAGLWITGNFSDGNPDWQCFSPNFYVKRLRYRESDGRVAIATYGRGLWTTDIFANGGCVDAYEPNDDWPVNAKTITPGVHMQGTIHKFLDADFFKFTIAGNQLDPGKDVTIHFLNKYNLGTVVALYKINEGEEYPEKLAHEIANKPVFYSGAAPGNYLVMVWGGYSAPETFLNCYDLQLEIKGLGEGVAPPPNQNGSTVPANPQWIKEDDWLSKMAKVFVDNKKQEVTVHTVSFGLPFDVQVLDATGRQVYAMMAKQQPLGQVQFVVPLTKLGRGNYRLRISDDVHSFEREVTLE